MNSIFGDLRLGVRSLARSPLLTVSIVACLAIGIGANTAMFSLVDQVMLRLLPVDHPEELVMISATGGTHLGSNRGDRKLSYPMCQAFGERADFLTDVFCRYRTSGAIEHDNATERGTVELITGNYFSALGTRVELGRLITGADDNAADPQPVAVISHAYWVSRFGSDPEIVGQTIRINSYPVTVIGVSAAGFTGLDPTTDAQVRVPIHLKPHMTPGWNDLDNERSQWVQVFARMAPGETAEGIAGRVQQIFLDVRREEATLPNFPPVNDYYRNLFFQTKTSVEPAGGGYSPIRRTYSDALKILTGMVGLVLLITCLNVANLLIARGVARRKEIATRASVGASRWQLIRPLLVESVMLAAVGSAVGVLLSRWSIGALLSLLPPTQETLMLTATPDGSVLAFTAGVACLTALIFGLAPAVQAIRVDPWRTLRDTAGAVTGGGSVRLRKALVAAEIAFSFVLLAGAGLFVKSLDNLKSTDTGFHDIENLVSFQLEPALNGYDIPQLRDFYRRLQEEIEATPGVNGASGAIVGLLQGNEWDAGMAVEGHQFQDGEDRQAFMNGVRPGYFETMGIGWVAGRDFTDADWDDSAPVAIVNRSFAEHFFGEAANAIGRHIGIWNGPKTDLNTEIVGVAEGTLYEGPRKGVHRQVFLPQAQLPFPAGMTFYVRTSLPSSSMLATLRDKVHAIDAAVPVYGMRTLAGQLDETLSAERMVASLSAMFGAIAALLAAVGLYGVMAFAVTRRTKELGIRMALGARPGSVILLVFREIAILAVAGLAIGLPAAYALSQYAASLLYEIEPTNAGTFAVALGLLTVVIAAAGFLPARRASTINPITALRHE